MLDENY